MSRNKICFNFMVCNKYHEKNTIPLVETVGKDILQSGNDYYLIGCKEAKDIPKMLKLSKNDDYYSLIEKTFEAIEYHYKNNTDFDWFLIAPDDTFINVERLNLLLERIPNIPNKPSDLFVVCNTRSSNGEEITKNGMASIKGGSGVIFNRKTFLVIRDFLYKHNYELRWYWCQDYTLDLLIILYNSNNLYDLKKQIHYLHIDQMPGDVNFLNNKDIGEKITIHNHFYGYKTKPLKTMYELQNIAKAASYPFYFSYKYFFNPSREDVKKIGGINTGL
jgi:hypothetical protein